MLWFCTQEYGGSTAEPAPEEWTAAQVGALKEMVHADKPHATARKQRRQWSAVASRVSSLGPSAKTNSQCRQKFKNLTVSGEIPDGDLTAAEITVRDNIRAGDKARRRRK